MMHVCTYVYCIVVCEVATRPAYHVAQNGGGEIFGESVALRIWRGKLW